MAILEGRRSAATPPLRSEASPQDKPRKLRTLPLKPGWPLTALVALYPLWWALGVAPFIYPILAVPMAVHLFRVRPVKTPPFFGIWLLYLVWVAVGALVLNISPPNTVTDAGIGRIVGYGTRLVSFVAVTILLLYVGNLTEREMPRRRVVRLLSLLFVFTIAGGLLGVVLPHLEFNSLFERILPASIRTNVYVHSLVHPASAQLQDVIGHVAPRPKAPFEYTNSWGSNLSILLIWFVVGCWVRRGPSMRLISALVILVAAVPIIYSLNRGMWIGLLISMLYIATRLAARGKFVVMGGIVMVVIVAGILFTVSPLQSIFQSRLENGKSNDIRSSLTTEAVDAALSSPILGYGNTRNAMGGVSSIAVGKTSVCPTCGNPVIGSNGQLWNSLISNGFVGAGLYILFFLGVLWRYRRDRSPIGVAGSLAMILTIFYALFYSALQSPIIIYMLSVALLWRNSIEQQIGDRSEVSG